MRHSKLSFETKTSQNKQPLVLSAYLWRTIASFWDQASIAVCRFVCKEFNAMPQVEWLAQQWYRNVFDKTGFLSPTTRVLLDLDEKASRCDIFMCRWAAEANFFNGGMFNIKHAKDSLQACMIPALQTPSVAPWGCMSSYFPRDRFTAAFFSNAAHLGCDVERWDRDLPFKAIPTLRYVILGPFHGETIHCASAMKDRETFPSFEITPRTASLQYNGSLEVAYCWKYDQVLLYHREYDGLVQYEAWDMQTRLFLRAGVIDGPRSAKVIFRDRQIALVDFEKGRITSYDMMTGSKRATCNHMPGSRRGTITNGEAWFSDGRLHSKHPDCICWRFAPGTDFEGRRTVCFDGEGHTTTRTGIHVLKHEVEFFSVKDRRGRNISLVSQQRGGFQPLLWPTAIVTKPDSGMLMMRSFAPPSLSPSQSVTTTTQQTAEEEAKEPPKKRQRV